MRLFNKILLAVFLTAALVLLMQVGISRWRLQDGFNQYLHAQELEKLEDAAQQLGQEYAVHGSWDFVVRDPRLLHEQVREPRDRRPNVDGDRPPPPRRSGPPPLEPTSAARESEQRFRDSSPTGERFRPESRRAFDREDQRQRPPRRPPPQRDSIEERLILLDAARQTVVGRRSFTEEAQTPVIVNGNVVGWLGIAEPEAKPSPAERQFLKDQLSSALWIALAGMFIAALAATILARLLSRQIQRVSSTIAALAAGDYASRMTSSGKDEFTALATQVNQLGETLEANRTARQLWTADISHELRTPLAVLKGELEALQDGVRPFDNGALNSLQQETQFLENLIADLHQLSMADAGSLNYEFTQIDLRKIVQQSIDVFRERFDAADLSIEFLNPKQPLTLSLDSRRITQMLHNLFENSIRYTDAGGLVRVTLEAPGLLIVEDTAPGLAVDECQRIFERLYRADKSRSRAAGGSGLGLSICLQIAKAHGGNIKACPSTLGGVKIVARLATVTS